LEIDNRSEVAVEYTLTVQNETGNLPLTFKFTNTATSTVEASAKDTCVLQNAMAAGGTVNYTMNAVWEVSGAAEDENLQYMGMIDYIVITLEVVQID
ncbi:MAG: hypothetical protein MJ091_06430, partial [Clostridia bacterium]|nr:hypothetical protein [Clostridia bacterium]